MALGDVIVSVNGSPVLKVEDLLCAIEEVEVGESVELMVRRRGTGLQAEPVRVRLFEPAGGGVSGGSSGALRGPQQRLGKDVRSSL